MLSHIRKRTVAVVIGLSACLAASACSASASGDSTANGRTDVSVMDIAGSQPAIIMQYAHAQGLDTANGLNFKFVSATNGPATGAALASGSIDFSDLATSIGFPLVKSGTDLVWLVGEVGPSFEVIVRKGVKTPHLGEPYPAPVQDLKGLKVGVTALGSFGAEYVHLLLKAAGLDSHAITLIAVGTVPTAVAAFRANRIDALVTFAPMEELLHPSDYQVLVPTVSDPTGSSPYPSLTLVNMATTTKSYIQQHRKTVTAFCTTMAQSIKQLRDPAYLPKALGVIEQNMKLTAEQASAMWKKYSPLLKATITQNDWKAQQITTPADLGNYLPAYADHVDQQCQQAVASVNAK